MLSLVLGKSKDAGASRKLSQFVKLTGVERKMAADDIIVSKTDASGRIIYCNDTFLRFASMSEGQLLGAPHCIIRHPQMPRCIFKLLWDRLASKQEVFAYVVNMAATGDHYWVFAHVTPSLDDKGNITGFHSNRRPPNRRTISDVIEPLYKQLLSIEQTCADRKVGLAASSQALDNLCREKGMDYGQLVHTF